MSTNSKKKQNRETTNARLAALRKQQAARERRRRVLAWIAVAVLVLGLAAAVVLTRDKKDTPAPPDIPGVKSYSVASRDHVNGTVSYPQTPPVGGNHDEVWLNCGVYDEPVPNENAVHDLEHGVVWITYQPNLPAAELERLKSLVRNQTYVDLTPYPDLRSPVVASAWGKQLQVDSADDPRLVTFISTYRQSPQSPEPGAPCTGGTGTPTG